MAVTLRERLPAEAKDRSLNAVVWPAATGRHLLMGVRLLDGVDPMALGEPHLTDGLEFTLKSCCGALRLTKRAGSLQDDFAACVGDQHDRRTVRVFGPWPAPRDHPNPVELGPECPKEIPGTPSH